MRWISVFALSFWATFASAQDAEIRGVISSQIAAFQADDAATAFSFASPGIQGVFGSADRFVTMVQRGYPMVWRPEELRFLELREIGGVHWQKVLIRDRAGQLHVLDYQMIPGVAGWKINAVQILPTPDMAA
ncbi:DUF4864 domain-containing protein [Shimia biformata]|uniref:DUF4864 domain-containing protein n=1 Tax=Shimia biformata TaxID=1294299 RepID=UPI00195110C9|nr:DUF4864 domain-containing protein [Shimia biformata]